MMPKARKAMQEVFSNTARWPAGFGGFTADVTANINGDEQKGTVTVKGPKEIETDISEEKAKGFLTGKPGFDCHAPGSAFF